MALRCLLVDDSPSFLASAGRLLGSQGVDVVGSAVSSDEALGLVKTVEADVALVDVQLGDEDGIELARRLASILPVVLISTRSEDELADLVADSPAVGFLSKQDLGASAIAALLGA